MSGATTADTTPIRPERSRQGQIVISVVQQATFLIALAAAAYLYWVTKDAVVLAILAGAIGSAQTNATSIVGYWIGSSVGSDKKTDLMAANPPPAPVPTDPGATVTRTSSAVQTVAPAGGAGGVG